MRSYALRLRLGMVTAMVALIAVSDPINRVWWMFFRKDVNLPRITRLGEILGFTRFMQGRLETTKPQGSGTCLAIVPSWNRTVAVSGLHLTPAEARRFISHRPIWQF